MLTTIREKTQGWIAGIILSLIAIPFALWGINSYFNNESDTQVATVDGVDISLQAYKQALEQQRNLMQQYLGRNFDARMFDNPEFKQQILNRLIDQVLIVHHARAAGYRISNVELGAAIKQIPQFQQEKHFDPKLYEAVLHNAGYTVPGFESRKRDELLTQQAQSSFVQGALVTPVDTATVVRLKEQAREVAYATVLPEKFLKTVTVSPEAVKNYYSSHAEQFKTPEEIRVEYVRLSLADIAKTLPVTDDELQKLYSEEGERFTTPEERAASHILIEVPENASADVDKRALAKAQDIRKQLLAGANFAALAKKYSNDPGSAAKGGDLGYARKGSKDYVKEFQAVVFSQKLNEISQPVKTQFGYHLIKVTHIKPEVRKPFSQVRAELETLLQQRKAEDRFSELSEKFHNLVYEHPQNLAPAAQALSLQVQQSDWFSRAGGPGIASEPGVIQAAFSPEVLHGANSDTIEAGENSLMAVHMVGHHEATVKSLTEVRDSIEQILKQQLAQEDAMKAGTNLLAQLTKGASLEALARQAGATYSAPQTLTRDGKPGIDRHIVEVAFKIPRPVAAKPNYDGIRLDNGSYAVVAVEKVTDGDPEQISDTVKKQTKQLLERRRGSDYYDAYLAGLRHTAKIKIYANNL